MKIKTQVSISIIVFVILAVVITSSYFSSVNQLQEIQKKQQIIANIEKSSFELYYLENDYIVHGGTRTVERWNAKYAELTGQLSELTLTDPSQQAVLNSLLDSHADLQTTFLNFVATTVSAQGKESISANQKVKEFAASTLMGHTQMMMASSSELSQMVKTEAIEVEQRTTLIISLSIAVLMIFVLLNYLLINRSVLRSIAALEKGAGRIGSGDLDTTIETGSNDELGNLSFAMTAMASNLKAVLTSKSNLEKEVAERKRAEEQLKTAGREIRQSKDMFRAFLDHSYDAVFIHDTEGKVLDVNATTLRLYQVTREEALGYTIADYTGPANPMDEAHEHWERALAGDDQLFPWQARHPKDGSVFDVEVYLTRITVDDRQVILGNIRDITERKRAEEALHTANKKLTLLSSITRHDIKNQLTVLMGYLSILEKKQPDSTLTEYFGKVSAAAQRILSMIQFTKEYESIGVKAPLWQDCLTLVDTAAKQAPLGQVIVLKDLPPGAEMFADPLIIKVFYNLMDNAVRYGGKITTIRFYVEESSDDPIIICEDDGVGVPAEEKEKIFDRGFGKNTGMGLFLSREILSITGITIHETGEPGNGARFEMTVPKGRYR